jgi:hypothetical protein
MTPTHLIQENTPDIYRSGREFISFLVEFLCGLYIYHCFLIIFLFHRNRKEAVSNVGLIGQSAIRRDHRSNTPE